jgi:predicted transcriptional regulator
LKYRSKIEIVTKLLEVATIGRTKTRLMYDGILSHDLLMKYLKFLEENNLLTYDGESKTYSTTEKGFKFLDISHQLDNLMADKINHLPEIDIVDV